MCGPRGALHPGARRRHGSTHNAMPNRRGLHWAPRKLSVNAGSTRDTGPPSGGQGKA